MKPLDPRLLREARASAGFVAASVLVGIATAALVIMQASLLADAIATLRMDTGMLLGLGAVLAGRAGLLWLQEVLAYRSAAAVKSTLRRRVLVAAVRSTAGQHRGERAQESAAGSADRPGPPEPSVGDAGDAPTYGTTLTSDRAALSTLLGPGLNALDDYFARYLPQLVLALVVPAAILVTLVGTDLISAGTVAVTLPLIPVFMVLIGLATRKLAARRFSALAILAHHFTDVVGGLATLKIFGRSKAQAHSVAEVSDAHRVESVRTMRLAFLSALVLELLASLSVALVAVGIGIRLVDGSLDLQTGLMVLLLAPEAYLPLRLVGQHYHASADGLAAAEQALRYPAPRVPGSATAGSAAGLTESASTATPGVRVQNLSVRGVSRLSFTVGPGEVIALYGPSGSGKSSVLAVLLGLLAARSGTAEITGQVTWVPQRPYLFAGTLGQNVRLGAPDASDELVRQAFVDAALDGEGLGPDRVIGEGGGGLSVGERRRVAVARALLVPAARAGVVLLDEPTAGLDAAAERRIAEATTAMAMSGRAVLLVTHRPAMSACADRVVSL